MAKKMLIDATHTEETRVVVVDGNKVEEFDFESENKRQLAGNIYLAKVTRVEPSLQAAFVDYGGNRHGFLAFSEIHPDYYQIPVADRQALLEEEAALAAAEDEDEKPKKTSRSSRSRSRSKPKKTSDDKTDETAAKSSDEIKGMETIDLGDDSEAGEPGEGLSPMETVHETPVAEPVEVADEPELNVAAPSELAESQAEIVAQDSVAEIEEVAQAEVALSDDDEAAAPEAETAEAEAPAEAAQDAPDAEAETADEADEKPSRPMAESTGDEDAVVTADPSEAAGDGDAAPESNEDKPKPRTRSSRSRAKKPAKDDVEDEAQPEEADRADEIENVADDDAPEDIRPARKPRPRRYKIQEVIKVRQIMLVQVVKEERGNKGAALTTYLSLAGRYCVLMPNTARGGGISRKITNAADRSKLKAIANEIDVPKGAGLIIRTAGAKRTKTEIKRDYEYLQRLWEQIRELTLKSIAPAKIYEEGDLIKRSIRDLYNRDIDEVLVEGEGGYRIAKDFMKMIMPSHAKNVKHYTEQMPLFARYQVESYLGGMFNPTVQLKSGGYIVIGVTEALVAIDVNSGRATKEGSIEETALKTNLEAAEEVARQLRLRDLAGLIVIDFIDMDERKNNAAVEKKLKDKLKTDRARIQVGRISGFGLLEMSRQRLRPGMIEATTQPCAACHGTGLIRSDDNMALQILRQIEEEGVRRRSREVLVKVPVGIANYLMNAKREHIAMIEARYGMAVRIEGDTHLIAPDFSLEKFKTATRAVPEATAPVVSVDSKLMEKLDEEAAAEAEAEEAEAETEAEVQETPEVESDDDKPKKKRRRRSRSRSRSKSKDDENRQDDDSDKDDAPKSDEPAEAEAAAETAPETEEAKDEQPKKPSRSRSSRSRSSAKKSDETADAPAPAEATAPEAEAQPAPVTEAEAQPAPVTEDADQPAPEAEVQEEKPKRTRVKASDIIAKAMGTVEAEPEAAADDTAAEAEAQPEAAPEPDAPQETAEEDSKPKKRGWWSLGR
ncbi:Rne/Rng family ribonuclease [Tropicibacter alexandrii]|uniref:Rne/Rng family ribonuclease n=1 Tax=Tropicibacter alexandrii TaxID=2267683 RepID=UPI000EF4AFB3|nr:ribonuclease E/G [Tropicibacter alexandrii]